MSVKPCPYCSEKIQAEARRCPHCGEGLTDPDAPPPVDPDPWQRAELHKYRQQIYALGGLNLLVAILGGIVGFMEISSAGRDVPPGAVLFVGLFIGGFCLTLAVLAVFLFLKHVWAVIVSLVFYCLLFLGNLVGLNVCGLVIFGAAIGQGFRVLNLHSKLRQAGLDPRSS